jgi:D-sedoheptulose 7-phosphate isomerase
MKWGSAADAHHLAAEFVSKLSRNLVPLADEALTVYSSILTTIGNDYEYENILSRQIAGKMKIGDIFLGITNSGNSLNIINTLETCRQVAIPSIVITAYNGGGVKDKAVYCIVSTGEMASTI